MFSLKVVQKLSFFLLCIWMVSLSAITEAATPSKLSRAEQKAAESAKAAAAPKAPDEVIVGIYLNDVQSIDLRLHNYLVDFYIWFKWKNPDINPAESMEFVNHSESWSTIMTNTYEKPEEMPDGSLYQVKHIQGKLSRKMDLHEYPFDKQIIQIVIEDNAQDASAMRYVIDEVSVNSDLKLPGFLYKTSSLTSSEYTHQTDFGDTRATSASTYSRLSFNLPIDRPFINAFMKNLLPILLTVVCCSFAFLLHPSLVDSRIQIAVFSLLSIVALQITSTDDLPTIEYMTLLDNLYVIGYFYCICVVAALTISTKLAHIHDGESDPKGMARAIKFDRKMSWILLLMYLALSLYIMRTLFSP